MDWGTIITSTAVTSLLGILALVVKSIISSNSERTGYDRKREERIEARIAVLEKKIEEKEKENDTLVRQNVALESDLRELIYKMSALLHKLTNIDGYEKIRSDVEELERELKRERK